MFLCPREVVWKASDASDQVKDAPAAPRRMQTGQGKAHSKAAARGKAAQPQQPAARGAAAGPSPGVPGLSAEQLHPSWAAKMLQKRKASLAAPEAKVSEPVQGGVGRPDAAEAEGQLGCT